MTRMQASCCSTLTCITICHEYALRDCTMLQTASMLKAPGCCKVSKEYVLVPTQFDCCCFMFHFLYVGSLLKCCDGSWLWQWWHSLAPAAAWKVGKVRKQLRLFCSRIATLCLNCLCCQLFCNSKNCIKTLTKLIPSLEDLCLGRWLYNTIFNSLMSTFLLTTEIKTGHWIARAFQTSEAGSSRHRVSDPTNASTQ